MNPSPRVYFIFLILVSATMANSVSMGESLQKEARRLDYVSIKSSTKLYKNNPSFPIVINTWPFVEANKAARLAVNQGKTALDAVETGCARCEELQCDTTVGFGNSPDENGETTLDAMIMDGNTHSVGAVGCLRRIKNAVGVARAVMTYTKHTILVGELASEFARSMGFLQETLSTPTSIKSHLDWHRDKCQPNFWKDVKPDSKKSCGPYTPYGHNDECSLGVSSISKTNHDTIGMLVIDQTGAIACATSSNGAKHKIPGRVGDSPIVGAGCYVDKEIGGAAATGDGDVMMRFLPSLVAVEKMEQGLNPRAAAEHSVSKIAKRYPNFSGALITVNSTGSFGAACYNLPDGHFPFSISSGLYSQGTKVLHAKCIKSIFDNKSEL